jgi:hypothetical protein
MAENRNLGVFDVMVNMVIPERHDSGRLRYPVRGEKGSLCMEIDLFRAEVRLWVVVFEGSAWCLLNCRGLSVFLRLTFHASERPTLSASAPPPRAPARRSQIYVFQKMATFTFDNCAAMCLWCPRPVFSPR